MEELSALGKKHGIPVIVDLGSGVLVDLEKYGLVHEPTVGEILRKGADVVCFSGDKLLAVLRPESLWEKGIHTKMEQHPLMRALRLDKCTTAFWKLLSGSIFVRNRHGKTFRFLK